MYRARYRSTVQPLNGCNGENINNSAVVSFLQMKVVLLFLEVQNVLNLLVTLKSILRREVHYNIIYISPYLGGSTIQGFTVIDWLHFSHLHDLSILWSTIRKKQEGRTRREWEGQKGSKILPYSSSSHTLGNQSHQVLVEFINYKTNPLCFALHNEISSFVQEPIPLVEGNIGNHSRLDPILRTGLERIRPIPITELSAIRMHWSVDGIQFIHSRPQCNISLYTVLMPSVHRRRPLPWFFSRPFCWRTWPSQSLAAWVGDPFPAPCSSPVERYSDVSNF